MSTNHTALTLYIIGILIAIASLILAFFGLPTGFDTEPILAVALLVVAGAGITSLKD